MSLGNSDSSLAESITTSEVIRSYKREELYRDVQMRLFLLLKTAQLDKKDPELFQTAVRSFLQTLGESLAKEGRLVIGERDGFLFLNGIRARLDLDGFAAHKFLVKALMARDLSGFMFEAGVKENDLKAFLEVFLLSDLKPGETLAQALLDRGVEKIQPIPRSEPRELELPLSEEEVSSTHKTGFKSIFLVKHLLQGMSSFCLASSEEAMNILQELGKVILMEEEFLYALDELRDWSPTLFAHSVDVALISVLLGQRMGLNHDLLVDLGIAGLFHDIGFVEKGSEVENHDSIFLREENDNSHVSASFRRLLRGGEPSNVRLSAAMLAYECGAARLDDEPQDLLSRILEVVNAYDILLKGEEPEGLSPAEAVQILRKRFGPDEVVDLLSRIVGGEE